MSNQSQRCLAQISEENTFAIAPLLSISASAESFLNKRRVTGEPPAFFKIGKVVAYSRGELDRFVRTCRRRSTTSQSGRRHSIGAVKKTNYSYRPAPDSDGTSS